MKMFLGIVWMAVLLTAGGCAWYDIRPISRAEANAWSRSGQSGYIIYQPELYFAASITTSVATNTDKTLSAKQDVVVTPVYLANPARPYRVTTHNFLSKADFSFSFENGWKLTAIADKSDNTALPDALAGQLATALKAGGLLRTGPETSAGKVRVLLYKPVYGADGTITTFTPTGAIEPE